MDIKIDFLMVILIDLNINHPKFINHVKKCLTWQLK